MKLPGLKTLLYIFFFNLSLCCYGQNFELKIVGKNSDETKSIDSLSYIKKHPNIKSIIDEVKNTSERLYQKGYINNKQLEINKINDTLYTTEIDLGKRIKSVHIYIGINNLFLNSNLQKKDSIIIPYEELETYLNQKVREAESQGFALNKLKLENIREKNSIIYADLNYKSEKKRTLNSIIINYSNSNRKDFFPKGHLKQLNKKYINRTFNQETVKELSSDLNNLEFITQTKYPEILFTNDSTKVFVYIEKRKANTFDGYIGFNNDEEKKLTFNGYLDISLLNTLHAGEQFTLYWKSDGNQQKTFNTKIEIPYLFKSPLGIKAQLNIFKQDSTFQNTKTAIDLGYFLNYNSRIYLGYQSTESSDIQNSNNNSITDFKNSYLTTTFEYKKADKENVIFLKKANLNFMTGIGKRNTNDQPQTIGSSNQFYLNLNASYNFKLNSKNYININSQNFFLKSDNYIKNELYRFGGLNSIRGFAENNLQANSAYLLLTEYRYLATSNLYLHTILDYGFYQDKTDPNSNNELNSIVSFGLGLGLQTKNGLIKIVLANGTSKNDNLKFYNTILNICYNVKF